MKDCVLIGMALGFIVGAIVVSNNEKAQKIADKTNGSATAEAKRIMMLSLFIFVAVPFPVTGVWTGTAIAVFLGLKFKESVLPIAGGNLIAGIINAYRFYNQNSFSKTKG